MGLVGFFSTYSELLNLAAEVAAEQRGRDPKLPPAARPVGRGRGSSVSSIICYLIGLSHVDPVRANLFPGRFLNEALGSMPDSDLDFPRDLREEIIRRVQARYGPEHVALTCTFATYHLRSAVRDVGMALGLRRLLSTGWRSSAMDMRMPNGLRIGQHPGGLILSGTPLIDSVPVEPARMEGRYLIQWDKESVDDAHFIKIDFLSLGMLAAVDDCLRLIEGSTGRRIDLGRIIDWRFTAADARIRLRHFTL